MQIRTLSLSFDLPLTNRQIPQWRGAFAELAGVENDLFHNHRNEVGTWKSEVGIEELELVLATHETYSRINSQDCASEVNPILPSSYPPKYYYRYPLIQYRAYQGQASIFALNDGIEAVQQVLSTNAWRIHWEGEPRPLLITGMQMQEYTLRMLPRPKTYQLHRWLALNAENYEKWQQCQSLVERITLLERVLTAHILAFAGSMGWHIPERLEVRLQDIRATDKRYCHDTPLIAFDISYTANVLLPPHIALGKAVSHGYGWQVPERVSAPHRERTPGLTKRSTVG